MLAEGCKAVAAGMNPMDVKRGMDMASETVVNALRGLSKTIDSQAEVEQVATVSANGDRSIGHLIADAMARVGKEGVITVQDGKTLRDELEIIEGMKFDSGFILVTLLLMPRPRIAFAFTVIYLFTFLGL